MKFLFFSLSILFIFFGCDLTDNSTDNSAPIHTTMENNGIEYTLDISQNNFLLYDTLLLLFKVKNNSSSTKEFSFFNVQQLSYQVIDQNNNIASYYPSIVSPALSHFSLEPGEIKVLNQIGIFKDNNGNFIKRGKYSLIVFLLDNNSPRLKLNISVN